MMAQIRISPPKMEADRKCGLLGNDGSKRSLRLRRSGPTASAGKMVVVEGLVEVGGFIERTRGELLLRACLTGASQVL